jgi:hypothetical protein
LERRSVVAALIELARAGADAERADPNGIHERE